MNTEKIMCDRVGKDYYDLLEQMVTILRHLPDTYHYLSDKSLDKIDDLSLKLQTGQCDIIEFKNQICQFDVDVDKKIKEEKGKNEISDNTKALNHLIKVMYDSYEINGNEISDTIHTFGELYDYRMLYNALWVNEIANKEGYRVFKSLKHEDGNYCFNKNGEWFIVIVVLPNGKVIDNHYGIKYWDLFKCQELEKSDVPYDGHTPNNVKNYMFDFLKGEE